VPAYNPKSTLPDTATNRGMVERVRLAGAGNSTETTEWVALEVAASGLVANSAGAATANTAAIQAALDHVEIAGGGVVLVPVGRFHINNTLNLGSRVVLRGSGWGSIIHLADGTSTNAAPKAVVASKGNTNYVGVEDIMLDGNKAGQTGDTVYGSNGIDFYARGTTEGAGPPVYDGGLYCSNVMVYNCKGEGFYIRGATTTMRVTGCYSYHNDGAGFWLKTDCVISDSVAANNGGYGFFIQNGTSVIAHGLKSFGSGHRYQATEFLISYCNDVLMEACHAEDCSQSGFVLTSCNHVLMEACQVYRYRGGAPQDANRSAFWIEDDGAGNLSNNIKIRGGVNGALGGGGGSTCNYALTTRNLGPNVDIELNTGTISIARWRSLSGATDARIVLDNARLDATQNPTFAASYTPVQYLGGTVVMTLTANVTINAPAEPYIGQSLRFVLTQDATGGRTTTFNAIFKASWPPTTTANAVNTITFVYNGTAWVQVASVVGL